jgi:hypothetical protein
VTGAAGRVSASIDVFAIMLTPSGTFSRSLQNGFAPWKTTRSACASMNSMTPWSSSLPDSTRPFGSTHNRHMTSSDRAR